MKRALIISFAALFILSGCKVLPPGHDPHGPGNSENAPGHNKACGKKPGKSASASGKYKTSCR